MSINVNNTYNFNFNLGGASPANTGSLDNVTVSTSSIINHLWDVINTFDGAVNPVSPGIVAGNGGCYGHNAPTWPSPIEAPDYLESSQPSGSLTTDGNKITTAGGYTIEPLSQFEWKITGPDGKSTRVWGDPHVDEGDGGKWDFKKNSTFVLGDGTRLNVTTVPFGNGATVTGQLEVISGNDRVVVSDIDKGKGKIGEITQDGYAHANSFQGDVFVQGAETDDWSKEGREVIGSNDQGETQVLGDKLPAGRADYMSDFQRSVDQLLNRFTASLLTGLLRKALQGAFIDMLMPQTRNDSHRLIRRDPQTVGLAALARRNSHGQIGYPIEFDENGKRILRSNAARSLFMLGSNPLAGNTRPAWEIGSKPFDSQVYRNNVTNSFRQLSRMFDLLARLSSLQDRLSLGRRNNIFA